MQVAAINDCLYRSMFRSRFVVVFDWDEIIVPYGASDSWTELLEAATRQWSTSLNDTMKPAFPAAYSLRSAFFKPDCNRSCNNNSVFDVLRVRSDIFPQGRRTKYFVWTQLAVMAEIHGMHMCLEPPDEFRTVEVPDDIALVHHASVRSWGSWGSDFRMDRYAAKIRKRESARYAKVEALRQY